MECREEKFGAGKDKQEAEIETNQNQTLILN